MWEFVSMVSFAEHYVFTSTSSNDEDEEDDNDDEENKEICLSEPLARFQEEKKYTLRDYSIFAGVVVTG